MVGRPPDPNRKTTNYLINFPDQDFINEIDLIAKREGVSRKALIIRFCREGIEKHGPGNPQTNLVSYTEGGDVTVHQFVGRARQFFLKRGHTTRKEILRYLVENMIPGKDRISMAKGLMEWLKEQGVEVLY